MVENLLPLKNYHCIFLQAYGYKRPSKRGGLYLANDGLLYYYFIGRCITKLASKFFF